VDGLCRSIPMPMPDTIVSEQRLTRELENFLDIAMSILPRPGEVPRLDGIDVWGGTLPLSGSVGGDHIIYVDFKQRFDLEARIAHARRLGRSAAADRLDLCRRRAGIALIDVAGHRMTDALLAAMLHQAFLVGALYELDMFGEITRNLFENLNTRFHQSSGAHKFMSLIYGEISEDARFRFLSAAQPMPLIFSRQRDRFVDVGPDLQVSFPPLGMLPSLDVIDRNTAPPGAMGFKERYEINEWWLMGAGDILLLHTDGLVEHGRDQAPYYPRRLEQLVREVKDLGARAIFDALSQDIRAFAQPRDDVSLVVVKLAA
jgi:serine phosphatase RsbU (regulator of sigma subunit)